MKQADLNRAVARATGETVSTVKRLGFLLADPIDCIDPDADEHGPYVIDWDDLEIERHKGTTWNPDMNRLSSEPRPHRDPDELEEERQQNVQNVAN